MCKMGQFKVLGHFVFFGTNDLRNATPDSEVLHAFHTNGQLNLLFDTKKTRFSLLTGSIN